MISDRCTAAIDVTRWWASLRRPRASSDCTRAELLLRVGTPSGSERGEKP